MDGLTAVETYQHGNHLSSNMFNTEILQDIAMEGAAEYLYAFL